ncbi:tRNA (N6-threonylcarbamoyladenosine(37)-N6)-methyltransferase TrmO [Hippea alviniae]|uniref:tRNA (N6-threonylcarbamoyladenosine(37)-N6)-methyltransferase TrmO n=1 Tax=Hippea alviniae TaxID=1279027 RepID=UPI0003B54A4F|nr:tRNA (N6-threonylcarbamoyladenosine(37)-N6)-methyltransferase TrmO [Hippea alviniae]
MNLKPVIFYPIGILKTKFKKRSQQFERDDNAFIEIKRELTKGLKELKGFSHIVVIFYFNRSRGVELLVKPLKYNPYNKLCGVFATRSPYRPNPIGFSIVKLNKIVDNRVYISNKDILNGTPILDIKPYLPEEIENPVFGWYSHYSSNTDSKS